MKRSAYATTRKFYVGSRPSKPRSARLAAVKLIEEGDNDDEEADDGEDGDEDEDEDIVVSCVFSLSVYANYAFQFTSRVVTSKQAAVKKNLVHRSSKIHPSLSSPVQAATTTVSSRTHLTLTTRWRI